MSNIKAPVCSLGARGTIGKAVTFKKARGQNIAEKKPELPFFRTLPVQYQRWLYQDYAYLWTLQSAITKQWYQTAGVRHHLTGFQYWMKDRLTTLPDIAGWWKLDSGTSPTTPDSSRNNNIGTVIGASPVKGAVGEALHFDGLNDLISIPFSSTLNQSPVGSFEAVLRLTDATNDRDIITKNDGAGFDYILSVENGTGRGRFIVRQGGVSSQVVTLVWINDGFWHHLCGVNDGTDLLIYLDGYLNNTNAGGGRVVDTDAFPTIIGTFAPGVRPYKDTLDNIRLTNRVLDPTEVLMRALRRYP